MNLSSLALHRTIAANTAAHQSSRFLTTAVTAPTTNSLPPKISLVQLQYGKPNKPTPPSTHKRLDEIHANIPTYPHPRRYWYKKANLGLYGNLSIRHGKQVSEQNKHRNPRVWRPNIHHKRLWSECLNRFIRLKIATRIIRTIDKCGGLDNYLLGNRKGRIRELGMAGWALRWRVLRTVKGRERAMVERTELGLQGEPTWMGLPFAKKWLEAQERKMADVAAGSTVVSVPVGGVAIDEEAALELERQIDEEFDLDDEAAARGEDGGIELDGGVDEKNRQL